MSVFRDVINTTPDVAGGRDAITRDIATHRRRAHLGRTSFGHISLYI